MLSSDNNMSLDLTSLSADEKEALTAVLKEHIDNFDDVVSGEDAPESLLIPEEVAEKIRDRVMNSVKLGDLSAEIIRFGTLGVVKVFMAMLNPALNPNKFSGEQPPEEGDDS